MWDGATTALVGGTGHTVEVALEAGAPVVWIDPSQAPAWRILQAPESLANRGDPDTRDNRDRLRAIGRRMTQSEPLGHKPAPGDLTIRSSVHPHSS